MSAIPTLSVVTISFNQGRFLKECVESVIRQKAEGIDYVVVDPGSTDGSREILLELGHGVDHLILEPDRGPADGLNKGFLATRGEILAYINSDDRFAADAFSWVRQYFLDNPDVDVLCGAIRIIDERGRPSFRSRTADDFDVRRYAAGICCIGQQATFFRRSIFERAGRFNIANRIAWDGELLVDMALAGGRFATVRKVLGEFRVYGGSITGSKDYRNRLRAYLVEIGKKLQQNGVLPYSPAARMALRLGSKLNPLRQIGYLLVR